MENNHKKWSLNLNLGIVFSDSVPLLKNLSDQEFAKLGDVLEEVRLYSAQSLFCKRHPSVFINSSTDQQFQFFSPVSKKFHFIYSNFWFVRLKKLERKK